MIKYHLWLTHGGDQMPGKIIGEYYKDFAFPVPEAVDVDNFAIATYYVRLPRDWNVVSHALYMSAEQTVGTWTPVPEITEEMLNKYFGRIIQITEIPAYDSYIPPEIKERDYIIQIAYPVTHFKGHIAQLISVAMGNILHSGKTKLVDLWLPKTFLEDFKGPKFGVDGIREYLKVYDRPILLNMIKPCTGIKPDVIARLFYEAARGGVDVIKDDELMMNPSYAQVEERVTKCMEAADKAEEETGEKTIYTVNITSDATEIFELADRAIANGVNGLMVNVYTTGFGVLRKLAEDPSINVPILAHPCFKGALYMSPYHGVSYHVLVKLIRVAGGDMTLFASLYGKFPQLVGPYSRCFSSALSPLYNFRRTFPGSGGGIHPGQVPRMIKDIGVDILIPAGGGVHGHPDGSEAGARALRQAIDATLKGIPLAEYAKDHPELKRAIEYWGGEAKVKQIKPL